MGHGVTIRPTHIGFTEILGFAGTHIGHGCLGACRKGHYLNGACGTLDEVSRSDKEALTRFVNIESVGLVLADFSWVIGRHCHKIRSWHNGGLVCLLGIGGHAKGVRVLGTHNFIDLKLLESALSKKTKLFSNSRADMNGIKRALTVPGNRILDTTLEEIRIILHTERISVRSTARFKHVFHLPFLDLRRATSTKRIKGGSVLLADGILLHTTAEEGHHVIVFVVTGRYLLT